MEKYAKLNVKQLKEVCKKHNISIGGSKAQMLNRLKIGDTKKKPGPKPGSKRNLINPKPKSKIELSKEEIVNIKANIKEYDESKSKWYIKSIGKDEKVKLAYGKTRDNMWEHRYRLIDFLKKRKIREKRNANK
eukprot:428594_1